MAAIFDQVDLVICSTNPDVAFPAPGPIPTVVDGQEVPMGNNGALTIPANFYGNPGISIPVGTVDGLPVGMQVMARHHREDLLLDLAALVERERPWPQVAPGSPV
jgi:aspartyl-tRNA(Asn)/glutamyl-tRNA(Gln) amidotransferase subunit A